MRVRRLPLFIVAHFEVDKRGARGDVGPLRVGSPARAYHWRECREVIPQHANFRANRRAC
jgi:hypothetical protein